MEHYLDKHEVMTTADKNGDDGKNENTAYKHDTRAERALELTLELYLSSTWALLELYLSARAQRASEHASSEHASKQASEASTQASY